MRELGGQATAKGPGFPAQVHVTAASAPLQPEIPSHAALATSESFDAGRAGGGREPAFVCRQRGQTERRGCATGRFGSFAENGVEHATSIGNGARRSVLRRDED